MEFLKHTLVIFGMVIYCLILLSLSNIKMPLFSNNNNYIELANFRVTAYCPGSCCNGQWSMMTSTGKSIREYMDGNFGLAAVDPEVIPMGTKFIYNGKKYIAGDVGGLIKGRRIDILLHTHKETVKFGVKENQSIEIIPD